MTDSERFVVSSSGNVFDIEGELTSYSYYILVDRKTGVNYLHYTNGGLTVLVDALGHPVVSREYIRR